MDYFARDACGLALATTDAPDWPQDAASASPCRFRPIPSLAMSPAEDGHLAGSGAQIWPWVDGSRRWFGRVNGPAQCGMVGRQTECVRVVWPAG